LEVIFHDQLVLLLLGLWQGSTSWQEYILSKTIELTPEMKKKKEEEIRVPQCPSRACPQ
jgi:hypothetical protein